MKKKIVKYHNNDTDITSYTILHSTKCALLSVSHFTDANRFYGISKMVLYFIFFFKINTNISVLFS